MCRALERDHASNIQCAINQPLLAIRLLELQSEPIISNKIQSASGIETMDIQNQIAM